MKFIRKFFSWTLIYKLFQFIESIYIYLKDYYNISDIFYSDDFKKIIASYIYIKLDKDWLGRLYGIINPNIGPDGKYDFTNSIYEIDGDRTNNDEFVKNIIFGKMELINRQFHINNLYEYITVDIKHVGSQRADNYLIVFDIVSRKYMSKCFKKLFGQCCIYGIIATILILVL